MSSANMRGGRLFTTAFEPAVLTTSRLLGLALLILSIFTTTTAAQGSRYLLGVGKADITGPVVEIGFAGYADLEQKGTGLRQRLYSRAFIIGSVDEPSDRIVYIVLDTHTGDTALRRGILEGLQDVGDEGIYGADNVAVTGTHSHAVPGAWYNYLLPQLTNLGFDEQSYRAIVDGAVLSVQRAHDNIVEGYLDVGVGHVEDAAINRSPYSYEANPEAERERYDEDVDSAMTLLRFRQADGGDDGEPGGVLGVLNWFAVHPTSMYQNNTHVAGDNKGVAAWLMESEVGGDFVAAFAQANHADTTPNVLGAWCDDGSGDMCSYEESTCSDGKSELCRGRGPEFAELDLGVSSAFEIGRRQYQAAKDIYDSLDSSSTPVTGPTVKSLHTYHDMSFWDFTLPSGEEVQTCPASLGYSFAAGTSDGPGAFDFTQGESGEPDNPLWQVVAGFLRTPTEEQKACQDPKPILLDVGGIDKPYAWSPNTVDVQTLRVGQLLLIVSSPEVTTMAGRRWREAVAEAAEEAGEELIEGDVEPIVILGGPANTYSHYVTTREEYDVQRYEGASTLFGRYTLDAYINLTLSQLPHLSTSADGDSKPEPGPSPPDNRDDSLNFNTGVVQDGTPSGRSFGDVLTQPDEAYVTGDVVTVTFQGANPRNNLRLGETFAVIEKRKGDDDDDDEWETVRDDADWFLTYTWERTDFVLGHSEVTIRWETGEGGEDGRQPEPGTYRIRYHGDSKSLSGDITEFEGVSDSFTL